MFIVKEVFRNFVKNRSVFPLSNLRFFGQERSKQSIDENRLLRLIVDRIRVSGPITVAEYMQMCVGNSMTGYYSSKAGEIFGESGDFVTSPEFTQMLGELVAIWIIGEVSRLGHRGEWQLVELGPGNGTLMSDILRVMEKFKFTNEVDVHLVESSERLVRKQVSTICGVDATNLESNGGRCKRIWKSKYGPIVRWYDDLREIPAKFSVFVAHEFFDALPVHKFRRTKVGWREIFIGLDDTRENLNFCLAPGVSLAQKLYLTLYWQESALDDVEISPLSANLCINLTDRITEEGGVALIMDYGHSGEKGDTLRAFENHKVANPLDKPGHVDLTADVNFKYLIDAVADRACTFGPIGQARFLENLGLKLRYEHLSSKAKDDATRNYLKRCYDILTSKDEMGERFKVVAMYPKVLERYFKNMPPNGFNGLPKE